MANKYCNLDGSKKIKDEYQKINIGFDKVEEDVNKINDDINTLDERVDTIITTPVEDVSAEEIIDARGGNPTLGKRFENIETAIEELDEIKDELDEHKADKVTDATKNPHGAFTEFAHRAVNVKWFGAVGDGVTDDTQALQAALASLGNSGGLVFVPAGTYLFNETLVIGSGQTVMGVGSSNGSTLLYTGTGSAVDIDTDACLSKIHVRKDPSLWTGDWNLDNPVSGVRLTGSRGRAEDIYISRFEIGLHLIGEGRGCAYNQVFLRQIYNCHKAIVLDATTVNGANGWVNENTIYGGAISIQSSYLQNPSYSTSWGIYMDCHTTNFPNNNKFIGVSIEGVNNGIRIVGVYNTFLNPRIEIPGTVKIVFQHLEESGVCQYNWIFGTYGAFTFGTHIFVKNADGTDRDYLNNNMIIGRGMPLQMTNDSLYFVPSYRQAMIKYDVTDACFEFWHLRNKIATLDGSGNLKIKGTVSENQTF